MARKRTAAELMQEGQRMIEQAKALRLQEHAAIGLQLMQIAEKFSKTHVECLAILQEQLLTNYPQAESDSGKGTIGANND